VQGAYHVPPLKPLIVNNRSWSVQERAPAVEIDGTCTLQGKEIL